MRALYLEGYSFNEQVVEATDDNFHHLVNVLRVKVGDEIKILNGEGAAAISKINEIGKKKVTISIGDICQEDFQAQSIHLYVCLPKKETLLEVLRICIELGITSVTPVLSQYSQRYEIPMDKIKRVLKNAYEQSNRNWKLNIIESCQLLEIPIQDYDQFVLFSTERENQNAPILSNSKVAYLIGPEGGFASEELDQLLAQQRVVVKRLNTPILRVPTAISMARGVLY